MSYNASFVSALKEALNGLKTVHQVGEEWVSYVGDVPTGGVPYCGQEVNRSTYSALWEYANAKGLVKSESEWQSLYNAQGGNVAFYSSGNGSSTFRMPRLVGYVRGASSQSESGSYVKEGLPNITGNLATLYSAREENNGAFSADGDQAASAAGGLYGHKFLSFDASRCSPIYGNSTHVTPETSVVLYGVYAFGEIGNTSALDASALASALARVESNLVKPVRYVTEKWSSGENWYVKYNDGWIEQGGLNTSKDAWVVVSVTLNTPFASTAYSVFFQFAQSATGSAVESTGNALQTKKTTSFNFFNCATAGTQTGTYWHACGF